MANSDPPSFIVRIQYGIALVLFCLVRLTYQSAPISDFGSPTIPAWYPYNLIETDVSCYKVTGNTNSPLCPMFPPGGRLSVFPNSEEKFHHALFNMHRMHYTPNTTGIENIDITKWWKYKTWGTSTYAEYYTGGDYCGRYNQLRRPLYWYSDANAAARFKSWDFSTCIGPLADDHITCDNALPQTIWSSNGNINIPTDRCPLFGSCQYGSRSSYMSTDDNANKGERPWFDTEGICVYNECFRDPHCDPIFLTAGDYVGVGFVEGTNSFTHQYVRGAYEISYELPIGMFQLASV